jgi:sugar diacid utilization regulator
MFDINDFLKQLSNAANLSFCLISNKNNTIFVSDKFNENSDMVSINISFENLSFTLKLEKKNIACLKLLKYTIENYYSRLQLSKEEYITNLLEGKDIPDNLILESIPFLSKGCHVLLINIDKNIDEALHIINEAYLNEEVFSIRYKGNILVIGAFGEVLEHVIGIKEAITLELFCKCYISFSNVVYNKDELKKAYLDCKMNMLIGKQFKVKGDIYNCSDLFLEKLIYNTDSNYKEKLLLNYKDTFDKLDKELLNTAEQFLYCSFNISDTAKKLYIHRNTLIYRLDKIKKEISLDIRIFNEAMIFFIVLLVWKEKTQKTI